MQPNTSDDRIIEKFDKEKVEKIDPEKVYI